MVYCLKTNVKHHPLFMKAFSYHLPNGQKQAYRNEIEHLTLEKLAQLIRICRVPDADKSIPFLEK